MSVRPVTLEPVQALRRSPAIVAGAVGIALVAVQVGLQQLGGFPAEWDVQLGERINDVQRWIIRNRSTSPLFTFFFDPISDGIDWGLRAFESVLLALPWYVVAGGVSLLFGKLMGLRAGLLALVGMLYFGAIGLWAESIQTFAIVSVSVLIALMIGIPVGIWASRSDRVERILRPVLDSMQTLPAFVYLIPVLLFFGVARVPSVVATVVYALPPVIRLTNLGIRQVPTESLEAGHVFGTTSRQMLTKVQIPLALPSILAGINQTIMMALGIVVIAALIGAGGLGLEVLQALRDQTVGRALEAGMAIVVLAILLDRLTQAMARLGTPHRPKTRLLPEGFLRFEWARSVERWLGRLADRGAALTDRARRAGAGEWLARHGGTVAGLAALSIGAVFGVLAGWVDFPAALSFSYREPTDALVRWARDNLYQIGELPIGTGPFSDFITVYGTKPLRAFFGSTLAWPVVVLGVGAIGWWASGRRLAIGAMAGMAVIGLLGMWELTMDTLSQTIVAVVLAIVIALPLGIAAARRDWVDQALRPVLDLLQTIPSFVFLVPVIILFNVGRVPGIIASVLYALPPAVRLTNLGIRQVSAQTTEAARAFGATSRQTLFKVQIPLAMPTILAGINQTVMLVLAMVVIAGLVGGAGLGLEAVKGLARSDTGLGFEAGISIVVLAMILDRMSQGWADSLKPPSAERGG